MTEQKIQEEREKVPVKVRKQEQKVEQEIPDKPQDPEKQWETPRRWRTY